MILSDLMLPTVATGIDSFESMLLALSSGVLKFAAGTEMGGYYRMVMTSNDSNSVRWACFKSFTQ
jgi:hypothetical protein